jgi:hypothetical protein
MLGYVWLFSCVQFGLNVNKRIREKQLDDAVDSLIGMRDKDIQKKMFKMMERIAAK